MRMFLTLVAVAIAALVMAGWRAPVAAQSVSAENPHRLPSTHFGSDGPVAAHGFDVPPGFAGARVANNPLAMDATPIGAATCTACHSREAQNFAHTTHALGMQVAEAADPQTPTCETCHGPGSRHAQDPTAKGLIIAFSHEGGSPIETQTATCLGCHSGGPRDQWTGSVHQRNELSCSDCHNPMARLSAEGLMAKPSINETCATCHTDIRQQFNRRSHMPLPEGQMACVDCHNPHGGFNNALIKTDTVNETCYQCHAEKRGPFLFEHAPVRDNCLNCHTPHGSNQHALLVAPVPMLCQQCHSHVRHPNDLLTAQSLGTGAAPDERLMGRGCLSCHAQIHGSNNPSGPRLHK
ncbi:DmsE family decaheme c-type cytochrome [Lysobacter avium]|uniref:DmsE family decaheme c-type cytochrome n=2 Tax=Novilysobacter avium TaxID=2781023 RepID=A0A7S6UM59_9GAMM|nr:DmsE family decaheme c-type cytochrome [Lysobacter avium]